MPQDGPKLVSFFAPGEFIPEIASNFRQAPLSLLGPTQNLVWLHVKQIEGFKPVNSSNCTSSQVRLTTMFETLFLHLVDNILRLFLFKINAIFYLSGGDAEFFSMLSLIMEWLSWGSLLLNKFFL